MVRTRTGRFSRNVLQRALPHESFQTGTIHADAWTGKGESLPRHRPTYPALLRALGSIDFLPSSGRSFTTRAKTSTRLCLPGSQPPGTLPVQSHPVAPALDGFPFPSLYMPRARARMTVSGSQVCRAKTASSHGPRVKLITSTVRSSPIADSAPCARAIPARWQHRTWCSTPQNVGS